MELAGGPVSWGVDFAGDPSNPPFTEVLAGIAAAGLRWMELGPVGYLPRGAPLGLSVAGTFVFDDFHRGDAALLDAVDAALDAIAAALDAIAAAASPRGGEGARADASSGATPPAAPRRPVLVLIDRPSAARAPTAGRSSVAPRLQASAWRRMIELLRRAGARAAQRGARAVVHPHAGSYLEFEDEVERLLDDAPELGLCLDTGHALYAGADPAELARRYAARLGHLHLKDVAPAVLARELPFWAAIAAGVFCPIGDGLLDLPALRGALAGYDGIATVEQDRRPGTAGDPAADLRRSVARLRAAGLG